MARNTIGGIGLRYDAMWLAYPVKGGSHGVKQLFLSSVSNPTPPLHVPVWDWNGSKSLPTLIQEIIISNRVGLEDHMLFRGFLTDGILVRT